MTHFEDQLTRRLQRYDAQVPSVDPAADLRRGQTRLRRRRLLTAGGAAGAVATIALGAALVVPHVGDSGTEVLPASSPSGAVDPSAEPTPADPTPSEQSDAGLCRPSQFEQGSAWTEPDPRMTEAVKDYRRIIAEHLDPEESHLERREAPPGIQSGSNGIADCPTGMIGVDRLGTKLGWTVAGQDGQGMIRIEVARPGAWPDSNVRRAYEGWQEYSVDLEGVQSAEVVTYDGGTAVVVHRSDGVSVAIDANERFGNNSPTPIDGFDFTTADLLEAAADPEFALP